MNLQKYSDAIVDIAALEIDDVFEAQTNEYKVSAKVLKKEKII